MQDLGFERVFRNSALAFIIQCGFCFAAMHSWPCLPLDPYVPGLLDHDVNASQFVYLFAEGPLHCMWFSENV